MERTTKISTIGLGLALGLAWAIGVLIVGIIPNNITPPHMPRSIF